MVRWRDTLIVFGGKSTVDEREVCDLWTFNMTTLTWAEVATNASAVDAGTDPAAVTSAVCLSGHSALMTTLATTGEDVMVVLFGNHPQLGLNARVYEYLPTEALWRRPLVYGDPVVGSYGQAMAYDAGHQRAYVYGGYTRVHSSHADFTLSDRLVVYDVGLRRFEAVVDSAPGGGGAAAAVVKMKRYLHTVELVASSALYVYGGDGHNTSAVEKCFLAELQVYSVACNRSVVV